MSFVTIVKDGKFISYKGFIFSPSKEKIGAFLNAWHRRDGQITDSIVVDYIDKLRNQNGFVISDEKKLRDDYEMMIDSCIFSKDEMSLEDYANLHGSDLDACVYALLRNRLHCDNIRDELILYYIDNNESLDGLSELDRNLLEYCQTFPLGWSDQSNEKKKLINDLNKSHMIQSNIDGINNLNAIDKMFGEGACMKVCGFKLYMDYDKRLASCIEKAYSILSRNGFKQLCYGDIRYDETNDSNVIYFYNPNTDSIYQTDKARRFDDVEIMESLIHELGHRFEYKFMDEGQRKTMKSMYDSKKRRFTELKKGDKIEIEDRFGNTTSRYTIERFDDDGVVLVGDDGQGRIEVKRIGLLPKIVKINGNDFVYESDGIPSSYALTNFGEFVAECFLAYNLGRFNGDVKKFFDGVFKK